MDRAGRVGEADGGAIAGYRQQAVMDGVVGQAEEHCLVFVKFGSVDAVEAQKSGDEQDQQDQVEIPGGEQGTQPLLAALSRYAIFCLCRGPGLRKAHSLSTLLMAGRAGSTTASSARWGMPVTVSLSRLPVRMPTTRSSRLMTPRSTSLRIPASVAAEAGSQPMPERSITALAARISSSVTSSTTPSLSSITRRARV